MVLSLGCHHVDGQRSNLVQSAVFYTCYVAIAHQCYLSAVNTDDAVYHIAAALYPSQDNMAYL